MSRRQPVPLRVQWRSQALGLGSPLSSRAKLAAAVLAEHSVDGDGVLNYPPAASTLADWMRCGERTARIARQELVEHGFVVLIERGPQAPVIRLTLPTPADSAVLEGASPAATPADSAAESRGSRGSRETRARAGACATPGEELTNNLRRHTNSRRGGVTDEQIAAMVAGMEAEDAAREEHDHDAQ